MKSQIVNSRKPSIAKRIGWALLVLFAIYAVLISMGYLTFHPENFSFAEQKVVYIAHLGMLMTHIIASMLAILIGPFQFLPGSRKGRWLKVHRWLGRTYLLSILFGGLSGLYMATLSYGGMISHLGFAALACAWLYTGYRAYRHIRNKDIDNHRRWMIRNYALTFAAVMLRIYVPLSGPAGFDFLTAYQAIAWLCWVPNLLVAEWIICRSHTLSATGRSSVLARDETSRIAQTEF